MDTIDALMASGEHVAPLALAQIYLGLGDDDQMFNWLEKAYDDRAEELHLLKVDPCFKRLHDDPRFIAFLKKMNF